jgi:RHS repeat-associated protein
VNQVRDVYNGLQQLVGQYQEHSGAVNTSTTPEVQYGYSSIASGSNLVSMTYPNGRILHYGYDNNALDTAIGRVDYLADDNGSGSAGSHLADYSYLGLSSILGQADGNGVTLSETLDSLGRIADVNWLNTGTSTSTDHFQYGYDRNGNVLYKNNLVNSAFSELYHANSSTTGDDNSAYDPLNRLTGFSRGTLSSSGNNGTGLDTVTTLNSTSGLSGNQQSWALDAVGNQSSVTTDGTATSRTANSQNELTGVGASTLTYDNNGNTTTDENGNTLTYDAWNHMVSDSAGSTSYSFDANGWRIAETHTGTTADLYFTMLDQVIEERQGTTVTAQNLWSIDYVNDLLLRDDNSTSGNLGISGSGLGNRVYYQHDANWNVTATLDTGANVIQRFVYTPYGVQAALTAAWVVSGANSIYGFQCGRYDVSTGMNHFGAPGRDYDPRTGTWIEKDSGYWDGANLYQSDNSNPVTMIDSTGLNPTTAPTTRSATQPSPTTAPSLPEGWSYGPDIALPDPDTLVTRAMLSISTRYNARDGETPHSMTKETL